MALQALHSLARTFPHGHTKTCPIFEEQFELAEDAELFTCWLQVACLPTPLSAQMYVMSGANANLVHLIDGQQDCVCCTWHIASSSQAGHDHTCMDYASTPLDIAFQWSPDGLSLAISAWKCQPMVSSFDHAAPQTLEPVSCNSGHADEHVAS